MAAARATYNLARTKPNAVFSFGRFQPPTTGHALLIDSVIRTAADENADAIIFVSSTENKPAYLSSKKFRAMRNGAFESLKDNENPLPIAMKVEVLSKQHAGKPIQFVNTSLCDCRSIMQIVPVLVANGYEQLTMIVGSDRVPDFSKLLDQYFPGVVKVLGIERVAGVVNARSMSGTKLRTAAVAGDFDTFAENVVMGEFTRDDAKQLMNSIRTALGYLTMEGGRKYRYSRKHKRHGRKTRRNCKK